MPVTTVVCNNWPCKLFNLWQSLDYCQIIVVRGLATPDDISSRRYMTRAQHPLKRRHIGSLVVFVVVLLHNSYAYMIATLM